MRTDGGVERPVRHRDPRLAVYPTMAELGFPSLPYEQFVERVIARLPYESSMHAASILQALVWHGDFRFDGRRQLALARRLMPGSPLLESLGRWVAEDDHIIFSEQALLALQRLLVLYAPSAPGVEFDAELYELFIRAILDVPGVVLTRSRTPVSTTDWQAYTLRGGRLASREEYFLVLARYHHMWLHLARSDAARAHPYYCPISEWYEATYDRGIDEDEAVCMASSFHSLQWLLDNPDAHFEELPLPENALLVGSATLLATSKLAGAGGSVFAGIAASREHLQIAFRGDERDPEAAAWGFTPFAKHPLTAIGPDIFVPVSPRLLEEWGTSGTYHRIAEAARRQAGEAGFSRFTQFFGELTEMYVREVLEGGLGATRPPLAPRVIPPQKYGPGGGRETTDALVDCAPDLVAVEVYSGRLSQGVLVHGSTDAVERDLRRLVTGKAHQMARALGDLRSGLARVGPLESIDPRRIFPIVVSIEGVTETPVVRGKIDDDLAAVWGENKLEPLLLLGVDELEELGGRLESGESLLGLIERGMISGWHGNGYSFFAGRLDRRSVSRSMHGLVRRAVLEVAAVLFDSAKEKLHKLDTEEQGCSPPSV